MNRIDRCFAAGRPAFIPYVTAGFPSVSATAEVLDILVEAGSDLIELGFPFSDPTADGPVIQASSKAALDRGMNRDAYFSLIRGFRQRHSEVPLIIFSYYNPVFRMGAAGFSRTAAEAGADGVLLVDLPLEEQGEMRDSLDAAGLYLIQLIAPTTPAARAQTILQQAKGFVYQISVRGVTGMRQTLGGDVGAMVRQTQSMTDLPVALGFGVSGGAQAAGLARIADAVIAGSALVRCVAENEQNFQQPLRKLVKELADATHTGRE